MLEFMTNLFINANKSVQLCAKMGILRVGSSILRNNSGPLLFNPSRTTIILKRRFPVNLHKEHRKPKLRKRNSYYDFVEDTDVKTDSFMDVVLKTYVSGFGNPGDIVSMKRSAAYHKLILPGLADYPTPENLEYSRNIKKDIKVQETQISPSVEYTMHHLRQMCLSVVMNKDVEWTMEPWHIRASFRKAGVHVMSDSQIELQQPVSGPNLDLEGKSFYITLTINKTHRVKVRCCLHHWSTEIMERLPYQQDFWLNRENMFPESKPASTGGNTPHSSSSD